LTMPSRRRAGASISFVSSEAASYPACPIRSGFLALWGDYRPAPRLSANKNLRHAKAWPRHAPRGQHGEQPTYSSNAVRRVLPAAEPAAGIAAPVRWHGLAPAFPPPWWPSGADVATRNATAAGRRSSALVPTAECDGIGAARNDGHPPPWWPGGAESALLRPHWLAANCGTASVPWREPSGALHRSANETLRQCRRFAAMSSTERNTSPPTCARLLSTKGKFLRCLPEIAVQPECNKMPRRPFAAISRFPEFSDETLCRPCILRFGSLSPSFLPIYGHVRSGFMKHFAPNPSVVSQNRGGRRRRAQRHLIHRSRGPLPSRPCAAYVRLRSCFLRGSERIRLPVAAKIALQIAGATHPMASSPMPAIGSSVARTQCTPISGTSFARSNG
jgi:hypothetical protein